MKLAYVLSTPDVNVNDLLADCASRLIGDGIHVAGTTQANTPRPKDHRCDMDVNVLPDGKIIRISQDLGANSVGCKLDTSALEEAAVLTAARLEGADLLVVNKFGGHEAAGRGFRDVIAEAVMQDIPVLVSTNKDNVAAFNAFAGGEAVCLEASQDALLDWARSHLSPS